MAAISEHSEKDVQRQYEILGVLGTGGFGTVYHARLKGRDGFTKDVALKILKNESPPEEVLGRFRDEARMLGLLRDRAIVGVEPPVYLDGRCAVVMEYVEGMSLSQIIKKSGVLPPGVALEIIGEVARALHQVWHHKGPNGKELHLMHRDLKPGNIQITSSGEVKILDFGIARAEFDTRETHTVNVVGTPGYIAPERLLGEDGPACDVFSLGVVLHVMLTGKRPKRAKDKEADVKEHVPTELFSDSTGYIMGLGLAGTMMKLDQETRPTARDVERRCAQLARLCSPPTLREWAEEVVDGGAYLDADDMVGSVLNDTITNSAATSSIPMLNMGDGETQMSPALVAGGMGVLVLAGAAFVLAVIGVAVLLN